MKLTREQENIVDECILKKSGGLSLNMGSGKTCIGLTLGSKFDTGNGRSIIVVSKNLVGNWVSELKKFFGDTLSYIVFHQDFMNINDYKYSKLDAKIIITTPEVLMRFYKMYEVEYTSYVEEWNGYFYVPQVQYDVLEGPLKEDKSDCELGESLFNKEWASIIVDECQNHTNIMTIKCRAICSLYARHKWVMSGTLFNEPKVERILGYYCMINDSTFPRTLPKTEKYIKSRYFGGISSSLVQRRPKQVKNDSGLVRINYKMVTNTLSREEEVIYVSMRNILKVIKTRVNMYKSLGDSMNARKYSSYLLGMLTYLRQCIICPVLVLANCMIDTIDMRNKSELSKMIFEEIKNMGLGDYLEDEESVKSSRIKSLLVELEKHPNDNVVVFTNFKTSIDIIKSYIPLDKKVYSIDGSMSISQREKILTDYKSGKGNILLLTYQIGAEGLNLQESNTVMLLDMYWNDGKSQQAIARVFRNGQKSDEVNVYIFTSNTGVEKAILGKQDDKNKVLNEMNTGPIKSVIKGIRVNDIIRMIDMYDCVDSLQRKFK